MTRKRKTILTVAVVAVAASAVVAFAVFSAFSSTTSNPGNDFAAGSVTLTGNNTSSAFYSVTGAKPGRTAPDQITLFKSIGVAIEDVSVGALAYENAIQQGAGTVVEM